MITSDAGFVIATPTKCGTTTLEEMCRRHRGGRAYPGLPSFRIMDWEQPRRQHRMALPAIGSGDTGWEAWGDYDRYLMVRDPYARYVSVYEYLRAPHNYSKFGAKEIQGRDWRGWKMGRQGVDGYPLSFVGFLRWLIKARDEYSTARWAKRRGDLFTPFAYRSPWVWLDSLEDSLGAFAAQPGSRQGSVCLIWVENFWPSMAVLRGEYGLRSLSVRPTIHANKTLTYKGSVRSYWDDVPTDVEEMVGVQQERATLLAHPTLADMAAPTT